MRKTISHGALAGYKPTLGLTVLRGCRTCGTPHPLARNPPAPDGECPECGAPSTPPSTSFVPAALMGIWGWIATLFLNIGGALHRLAKEISP